VTIIEYNIKNERYGTAPSPARPADSRVSTSDRAKNFPSHLDVQNRSGAHPVFNSTRIDSCLRGGKADEA
jgi:hypothetical protein